MYVPSFENFDRVNVAFLSGVTLVAVSAQDETPPTPPHKLNGMIASNAIVKYMTMARPQVLPIDISKAWTIKAMVRMLVCHTTAMIPR
jgi:hypothetical protein